MSISVLLCSVVYMIKIYSEINVSNFITRTDTQAHF